MVNVGESKIGRAKFPTHDIRAAIVNIINIDQVIMRIDHRWGLGAGVGNWPNREKLRLIIMIKISGVLDSCGSIKDGVDTLPRMLLQILRKGRKVKYSFSGSPCVT